MYDAVTLIFAEKWLWFHVSGAAQCAIGLGLGLGLGPGSCTTLVQLCGHPMHETRAKNC